MLAAALPFGLSSTAAADPPSCPTGETPSEIPGGWICIPVQNPGDPDTEDPGNGTPGGGEPTQCQDGDKVVPCTDEHGGTWDAGHGCYGFRLDPQPPANSPLWRGHDPSEGSIWSCDHTVSVLENTWFVANGAEPLVDPAVLAQTALGRMKLERADAEIAPGPEFHTYVHIDNWLWVPADQWRALRETVSAGPTSVTVTAAPARVEWDLGPETKICYDAGRAWVKGMTDAAKTTCSHAYEAIDNPIGDTHDVSAQIVYGATWTCSGACVSPSGDLGEITAPSGETTTIEVRQRQTVVTN
ncbi:hypothetical protein D0Z08_04690 [Nocardioides immobilis]|uniref:Uncharacterized protein n=2 Tax=Nocardioides immobilis TaxID=2049295 RepID=A0A417Y6G1_9ACTN|nr:hypothetical protein D0Z08_04690 [Nocardioides immobilis]